MEDASSTSGGSAAKPRLRWNDIRIVGPLLVLVLALAVAVNPSFASSNASVGGEITDCNADIVVVDPCCPVVAGIIDPCCDLSIGNVDPCIPTPTPTFAPTSTPEPTPTSTPPPTAVPTATAVPTVAPTATPIPDSSPLGPFVIRPEIDPLKIMGPTWLGPIVATEANGIVTLRFPLLLSIFVGPPHNNEVVVTSASGLEYRGPLPAGRQISFPSGDTTFTVESTLINDAEYTEIVTVGSSVPS